MSYLLFKKPGIFTSIQDNGRPGLSFYGISKGGYMDPNSADLANKLVGNKKGSPVIECSYTAPTIEFGKNFIIALSGADMNWTIDRNPIPRYTSLYVRKGSILSGSSGHQGIRAYIAIQGSMDLPKVYNSYSHYSRCDINGENGLILKKGDKLPIKKGKSKWQFRFVSDEERPPLSKKKIIPIHRGPEWHLLNQHSKESMMKAHWSISTNSDRMGANLTGHTISFRNEINMDSVPVFPGIIQAPIDGSPIVVLQDGQTAGGYPRIAFIPQESLGLFNQIRPQEAFSFYLVL